MRFVIFLALLNIAITSSAADENVEVVPKETVVDDTSEFHRLNKTWLVDVQLTGIGPSYATNRGLSAGYFLNRNMLLVVEAMGGSLDSADSFSFLSSVEIKGRSAGAHFKHFVGNSFYYRIGLDWRQEKYNYTDLLSPGTASFETSSLGITFNIGNQWQWKNFNLGCDWVGITTPISKSIKNEVYTGSLSSAIIQDDQEILTDDASLNLLRFYLGASF